MRRTDSSSIIVLGKAAIKKTYSQIFPYWGRGGKVVEGYIYTYIHGGQTLFLKIFQIKPGVCIFQFDQPQMAKIWPNNMLGKLHIFFPQMVKSMHIFSLIDKKWQKKAEHFSPAARTPFLN